MWTGFAIGFMAGLSATPHCLGMCGGFPLHLARAGRSRAIVRQGLFVLGKSFTYVFLGALAGTIGVVLFRDAIPRPGALIARIAAGLLAMVIGAAMLGVRLPGVRGLQGAAGTGFFRSLFGGFLASPGPLGALVLGLGVGFLPCPLPMGMLAIAAGTRDVPLAMALMAGIGLGTAPGLLAVGLFGAGLDRRFAQVGMRAAGVVVVLLGLLIIGRAAGIIPMDGALEHVVPSCCTGR